MSLLSTFLNMDLKKEVLFLFLFFSAPLVFSSPYESRYLSVKAAGMGNVLSPSSEDLTAGLFYQPAVLSRVTRFRLEPFSLSLYGNTEFLTYQHGQFYQAFSLPSYASTLQKASHQNQGLGGSLQVAMGIPGFFVGLLLSSDVLAKDNADQTLTYGSLYQLIPVVGTAVKLWGGRIRFGYSFQWIHENSGQVTVPYDTLDGYRYQLDQGSTFSHQVGGLFVLPLRGMTTFGFIARNVGGTHYSQQKLFLKSPQTTGDTPRNVPMTIDTSLSVQSAAGRGGAFQWVTEYRDIENKSGMTVINRLASGFELSVYQAFFLRLGWRSGYPAGGFGIKTRKSELDVSIYTKQLNTFYQSHPSTQVMLQYKVRSF